MGVNTPFFTAIAYALLEQRGIGPVRANSILNMWVHMSTDPKVSDLAKHAKIDLEKFERSVKKWLKDIDRLRQDQRIGFLGISDPRYPKSLREVLGKSAPPVLSYIGNPGLLNGFGVGFCGSRNASVKGLNVASMTARDLARAGAIVVSGYARGVDLEAHVASLEAGGRTILVLAEGIMNFRRTKLESNLGININYEKVLVISEFLPYDKWSVSRAMQRNKTIIALSKALIVIEASKTGGTIEAGKAALKLGVPVFAALYGQDQDKWSEGNRLLFEMGARKFGRLPNSDLPNTTVILDTIYKNRYNNQKKLL